MRHAITTNSAPGPGGPYSQAVVVGDLVFLSGQRPVFAESGLVAAGFADQAHQVLRNVEQVLRAAGSDLDHVAKVAVHLANLGDFDEFNLIYRQYFREPYPARTTVGSTLRGILVEIDVTATLAADNGESS